MLNKRGGGELGRDALQVAGIALLAVLAAIIVHKAYADISGLARLYAGEEFWRRLGRYLLANLAG